MDNFMRKYSVWITTVLGVAAIVYLIVAWQTMPMLQKIVAFYLIALACHEWEELKIPGGFVELVTGITGIQIGNLGIAKFGLLMITIYAAVVPMFIYNWVWPCMALMLVGYVEIIAHLFAARINTKRFYSPGLITAAFLQFPAAIYGTWYMFSNGLVHGIYWLWAILYLFIPLLICQGAIVKSNGMKYSEFWGNARKTLLSRKRA